MGAQQDEKNQRDGWEGQIPADQSGHHEPLRFPDSVRPLHHQEQRGNSRFEFSKDDVRVDRSIIHRARFKFEAQKQIGVGCRRSGLALLKLLLSPRKRRPKSQCAPVLRLGKRPGKHVRGDPYRDPQRRIKPSCSTAARTVGIRPIPGPQANSGQRFGSQSLTGRASASR